MQEASTASDETWEVRLDRRLLSHFFAQGQIQVLHGFCFLPTLSVPVPGPDHGLFTLNANSPWLGQSATDKGAGYMSHPSP